MSLHRNRLRGVARPLVLATLGVAPLAATPPRVIAQDCASLALEAEDPRRGLIGEPDLRCIDLVPVPEAFGLASGRVELLRPEAPFTVAVAQDGAHAWRLRVRLDELPHPSTFSPGAHAYVAWATTPVLRPFQRLGPVRQGQQVVGEVALDKFIVLISAEASDTVSERRGPLVLRGTSPSMRLQPEHMPVLLSESVAARTSLQAHEHEHAAGAAAGRPRNWPHPAAPAGIVMLPGMMPRPPEVTPLRASEAAGPEEGGASAPAPAVETPLGRPLLALAGSAVAPAPRQRRLAGGATTTLTAGAVTRALGGGRIGAGVGYEGGTPGPTLRVRQGSSLNVLFRNRTRLPLTVHWHGLRLENRFDGVPGLTQEAVPPGGTFEYRLTFPDPGLYWYHPHERSDIAQDLGLYGNIVVDPASGDRPNPVDHEVPLLLDDVLMTERGDSAMPHGAEHATHALMGRFGNVMLVNGRTDWSMDVHPNEVVRLLLTNTANTRTFNLSFGVDSVKLVAGDIGNFTREAWVASVPIAPAERYAVELRFEEPGDYLLTNRVRGIDHVLGAFVPRVDTLGVIRVRGPASARGEAAAAYGHLREYGATAAEIEMYRPHFDRPVDRILLLRLQADSLPFPLDRLMRLDSAYFHPVEWDGTMPHMNWILSAADVEWVLEDAATGARNHAIDWDFERGSVALIRIVNMRGSLHAMQHPIHLHGQRFLVVRQDGEPNGNLVWKDTVLVPVGSWVDLLVDFSNPGSWMLHCHIAEHLEAGMHMVVDVNNRAGG